MKTKYNEFLQRLKRQRKDKGKITYLDVYNIFIKLYGKLYAEKDYERELNTLLNQLSNEKRIILQSSKKWDYTKKIPRPNWIKIVKEKPSIKENPWKTKIWTPQLEWISKARIKKEKTYLYLWQINEFIKYGYVNESLPEKERSLQLFGQEKKLRELNKRFEKYCDLFSLTQSYKTHEPLCYRDFTTEKNRAIIIENRDTYDSFCRVNSALPIKDFQYIIYGDGFKILERFEDISTFTDNLEEIEYFGDLDPTGLFIPQQLKIRLLTNNTNLYLNYEPFYKKLIELYKKQSWKFLFAEKQINPYSLDFLQPKDRTFVKELFDQELRIPQELLNKIEIRRIIKR